MDTKAIGRWRTAAYSAQGGLCWWCRQPMLVVDGKERHRLMKYRDPSRHLICTAEHLTPLSQGGRNTRSNIVAACAKCNSGRHHWASGRTMDQCPTLAELPPQRGQEHHALADARWTREAWEFLTALPKGAG